MIGKGGAGGQKTCAVVFPFDLFGSRGAGAGAELLADALREMLADNRRERVPTRARAYRGKLTLDEVAFDTLQAYQGWGEAGRAAARRALASGEFLLWLAGNHLGVLPVYEELRPEDLVVQLDAHLDVYHLSDCTAELSHGNFLLHSAAPLPRLVNVGHRELLLTPDHVGRYYERTFPASDLAIDPGPALAYLRAAAMAAPRVFLDIDCDAFDRAYFPGAAHPVPFGLSPAFALRILDALGAERLAGLALSEFDPARDEGDHSLATLLWLIEFVLLARYERPRRDGRKALDTPAGNDPR